MVKNIIVIDGIEVGEVGKGINFTRCGKVIRSCGKYIGVGKVLGNRITLWYDDRRAAERSLLANGYWLYRHLNDVKIGC